MSDTDNIIAHRGASAYAPENTISAFNKAAELGANWVEFDVMLSDDGEPFVFHDERLNRTTNGKGVFAHTTSDKIKTLDAGAWFSRQFQGEEVPALKTVLDWLIQENIQANIEIKPSPGKAEETTMAVLATLNGVWPSHKPLPLLSSFEYDALRLCRNISPEAQLGLLIDKWDDNWLKLAKQIDCYSVHLNKRVLTQKRVEEIKRHGYKVFAYTVNRKRQAKKLLGWGVDAIFSDYPDLLA